MNFQELFHRANLNVLENYLLNGGDTTEKPSDKSYQERLREAEERVSEFLHARCSNIEEFDEIYGYYGEQIAVYEEVYFELGLILGAKIGFQIHGKMG